MSVLLQQPLSLDMRSPPTSPRTDPRGVRYRAPRAPTVNPSRSPQLLHRPQGGRVTHPRSPSSLSLSIRNQQLLWEAVTGSTWETERVNQNPDQIQSLQYIAPQSLAVSPAPSVASTSAAVTLESISAGITTAITAAEPAETRDLLSSMEFMIPPNYNHFGSYPSSYTSSYMAPYEEDLKPRASSPPPPTYAPTYPTATSTPLMGGSPALSVRGGSVEQDSSSLSYRNSAPRPYEPTAAPSGHPYTPSPHTSSYRSYPTSYQTATDPYSGTQYSGTFPPHQSTYLPIPPVYQPSAYGPSGSYGMQPAVQPDRMEQTTQRTKPVCWMHGCNGKEFSTLSNLLRHQREKSGTAAKAQCPKCGAYFTRTTARNGHVTHGKCKQKGPGEGDDDT